ncbi:polysaccharide pyruvyl transferase family protein [Microbacterium sp. AR7-10]|uniref:polysaccharide pyruvyl transferase family protein n=1 Tax=Microbacterium sp. AR7-10 TaxID=1891970 RepID=UPI0008FC21A2|nr:polysaccharide pyruvyl transferase family protein [Microbacterium sp. AR7-10]
MTEKRRALIVGPYKAHNFGDDLVGGILARHLQQRGYEVSIPRLSEANSAWLGTAPAEGYEGLFESADLVVVGGGGIMSDTSGAKPGASHLQFVADAQQSGALASSTPVVVTSVGAGPWLRERSRKLALGVSSRADAVGVRDQESYDHLRGLGVPAEKLVLGADVALLTPEYLDFASTRTGKLGFQFDVSAFEDVQSNPELPEIVQTLGAYAHKRRKDVILIRNGRARSEIAPAAPGAELLSYTALEDFLPRLAGMRALFTSHLHLAITSYSQRIPTFSLYVREKTRRFYEQIGHPERAIDLRVATVKDLKRFLAAAEKARWTDADEAALSRLKAEAKALVVLAT